MPYNNVKKNVAALLEEAVDEISKGTTVLEEAADDRSKGTPLLEVVDFHKWKIVTCSQRQSW